MPDRQAWLDRVALIRASGMAAISEATPPRWFPPDFIASEPAAVAFAMDMLNHTDPGGYAGCGEAIAGMDLRPALGTIKAPTLVIAGSQDTAAPPWQAFPPTRASAALHYACQRDREPGFSPPRH